MGCCGEPPRWHNEDYPSHKFDQVDLDEYRSRNAWDRFMHMVLWIGVIASTSMYVFDLYQTVRLGIKYVSAKLHTPTEFSNVSVYPSLEQITAEAIKSSQSIPPTSDKYWAILDQGAFFIYAGSLIISLLLLYIDYRKARRIINSSEISLAFTNSLAYNLYSLKSYSYFGFFQKIDRNKRFKDDLAFFIFFRLKGMSIALSMSIICSKD